MILLSCCLSRLRKPLRLPTRAPGTCCLVRPSHPPSHEKRAPPLVPAGPVLCVYAATSRRSQEGTRRGSQNNKTSWRRIFWRNGFPRSLTSLNLQVSTALKLQQILNGQRGSCQAYRIKQIVPGGKDRFAKGSRRGRRHAFRVTCRFFRRFRKRPGGRL